MVMECKYVKLNDIFGEFEPTAICIGHFDGVHLGHQALIHDTNKRSKQLKIKSAMITFDPDPQAILSHRPTKLITTIKEKISRVDFFGIDILYIIKFDQELAKLNPDEFITKILLKLNIQSLTCGFDFRFGLQGQGTVSTLQKSDLIDFPINVIDAITYQDRKISSTWINELLSNGLITDVNKLLGYPFSLTGNVIKGHQVGRKINFPTANINYDPLQSLPKIGVYVGVVKVYDEYYKAMINVGKNPTFYDVHQTTIEAHILDFDLDIYNQEIRIIFLDYLRDEVKYASAQDLIKQLNQDIISVIDYFNIHKINMSLLRK